MDNFMNEDLSYKEIKILNVVEEYIKRESMDGYKRNNIREIFEKARKNKSVREKLLEIINKY